MDKGLEIPQEKIVELIKFQLNRKITNLSKSFLVTLEEIRDNSSLQAYNNFDYIKYRKRCLDEMNNSIREIDEILNKLNVTLK
jgi:hypothetical protein